MTPRSFSPSRIVLVFLATVAWLAPGTLRAQTGAETATAAGVELFNAGDYEEAAKAFEQVLADYPTSPQVPEAQMRAGYSYFLVGNYSKAIEFLEKILEPPAPPMLQEIGHSLLPQAIAAGAADLEPADPARKAAFERAIAQFGVYLEKYPETEEAESALYGRALSYFQIEKYDEAIADLRRNLQAFANSRTILDSQYLLALTLATKGNALMQEEQEAGATPLFDEAEKLLLDIHTKRTDIALANDAMFQVGEIRFNRAVFSGPGEAAKPHLLSALAAYRTVEEKERMIEAQEQVLQTIQNERAPVLRSGNQEAIRRLQRLFERESSKLEQLRERQDQTLAAALKAGQIFYQIGDYDATRILMQHVRRFSDVTDDQRTTLYFITMTYALQGEIDKALAHYEEFQGSHRGHPIASNLPLAIGTMLIGAGRAEEGTKYVAEQNEIYPESEFAELAMIQQANAHVGLGQYEDALKVYQDYLEKNPDAEPAVAVQAELGVANVYKDTARWEEALVQYRKVLEKYPGQEDSVRQASFWVAYGLLQSGDPKGAVEAFTAFLERNPDDANFGPAASFTLAQAQQASGDTPGALATFIRTAEKFPGTEPASFAYFQMAQIHASAGNTGEVIAAMREFVAGYPEDTKVFAAYDTIGQNLIALGNMDDAIAAYVEYDEKYPAAEETPKALLKLSELWRGKANTLGRFIALNDEQRVEWNASIAASIAPAEQVLERFPDSPVVALALQSLLETQRLLLGSQQKTPEELESYFQEFAAKFAEQPATRSKVLFTLASFLHENDPERALALMTEAYSPEIILAPQDLDLYGLALIEKENLDEAEAIYNKIAGDYPIPPGTDAQQALPQIQDAQATALYGLGKVQQERGNITEAGELFERLRTLYPWSPKLLEANYGIAAALFAEGKGDDALALAVGIIRASTATADLRAKSMLLGGYIQKAASEKATDPKEKEELLGAAIDYFIKIATFYEGVPGASVEGLWEGAQLLEQQAAGIADPAQKARQLGIARRAYQDIVDKFPASPRVPEARQRLAAMGN